MSASDDTGGILFGKGLNRARQHGHAARRSRPVIRLHGVDCLSCHDCLAILPAADFYPDGHGNYSPYCKPCHKARKAARQAKKKAAR